MQWWMLCTCVDQNIQPFTGHVRSAAQTDPLNRSPKVKLVNTIRPSITMSKEAEEYVKSRMEDDDPDEW